jgi:hypothetical protein
VRFSYDVTSAWLAAQRKAIGKALQACACTFVMLRIFVSTDTRAWDMPGQMTSRDHHHATFALSGL